MYLSDTHNLWDIFANQTEGLLKVNKQNNWQWGDMHTLPKDPNNYILETLQGKIGRMWEQNNKQGDLAFIKTSKLMVEYYPKSIYGYSNLANFYLNTNQLSKAESYFIKALKINPNDKVVTRNYEYFLFKTGKKSNCD